MSDPASKSDGDTVLASIRRLVLSDEGDTRSAPARSEPLILTEALRVDPEPAEAPRETSMGAASVGNARHGSDTGDAYASLEWQDTAEAPETADTSESLPDNRTGSNLADAVVDEDFLRDIVSEIVREELQGDLGERITRNVRKLVRREIHRAMASRDFND